MYQNMEQENENVLEKYGRNIIEDVKKGRLIRLLVGMKKFVVLLEFYLVKLKTIRF